MYARDLMFWLHERLSWNEKLDQTQTRFESLRGYALLPRGRENSGIRLSDEQIANAVLSFAHPLPGSAGLASLILGDLRPVGGAEMSYKGEENLRRVVANLVGFGDPGSNLLRLTLSVGYNRQDEEYSATISFRENDRDKTASFVSKYNFSLLSSGAEKNYKHERLQNLTAVQRSFGSTFFRDLSSGLSISRKLDRPLKTDWREYETEQEKENFYQRLGARSSSRFLNLRVDAEVAWPKEPTRTKFGGHHFVLFPKTKDYSNSISIDLVNERISVTDARSLINRMLSVMSWCEDRPASLHEGWSGNPIPVQVPRKNLAFMTMPDWYFCRTVPDDDNLKRCLAYYRDGLNASSVGLASHAVVSFFRVFETTYDTREKILSWVNDVFPEIRKSIPEYMLNIFEENREKIGVDYGNYIYKYCRVATAHAARDVPSDPDIANESRRLFNAAEVIRMLARYFIKEKYNFSDSYLTDDVYKEKLT